MNNPVILLVDDEPDLLQVLTEAVSRAQPTYEVLGFESAAEAQACLDRVESEGGTVALAMVDHMLGGDEGGSGLALLEELRERFPAAATFLFTGRAPARIEEQAEQSGTRVLWKPLRLATLLGHVDGALVEPA